MMLRLTGALPRTRQLAGTFWVTRLNGAVNATQIILSGRCRGEADNTGARTHENPQEDPTRPYGDHPYGTYLVTKIVRYPRLSSTYGPAFLLLDPISGEAAEAKEQGRTGIGIHGGSLHADGSLRETYGCLRLDNATMTSLADLVESALADGETIVYTCRPAPDPTV